MTRFKFDWQKAIEAIDFIARHKPKITQYYIGKIMFFADREHLLDYGRPVTGDRYVAMEHGPVPSGVRDILKADSDFPDEILDTLNYHISIEHDGNKQMVSSNEKGDLNRLSGSDQEYLLAALKEYSSMSFKQLKNLSHEDSAYQKAWEADGNANEMDLDLWLDALDDPAAARLSLEEFARCGV